MKNIGTRAIATLAMAQLFVLTATADEESVTNGEEIYRAKCEYCHGAGIQKGGTMRLEDRYQGSIPALLEERTDLTPAMIQTFVRTPTLGMTPFRLTEIDDGELEDLVAFLTRNNPN